MHPGHHITEVYLHAEPIDFRKQMGGLAALVQGELQMDPFGTALFVFVNHRRTSIKALYWHRNGFLNRPGFRGGRLVNVKPALQPGP